MKKETEYKKKIVSIITVVYNDKKYIEKTIESVINQSYPEIEYIVIDGGSVDGTLEVIKKYEDNFSYYCSEPDGGIYEAMNKGLTKSKGEYVFFLNAGDMFPDFGTLQRVAEEIENNNVPEFIYGDAYEVDIHGNKFLRPARMSSHKKIGMFTHHQSMYYKREVIEKFNLRYDTSLKIAADYKFTCQFLEHAKSELYIAKPLSVFLQGGLSQVKWAESMKEQIGIKKDILGMPYWKIYLIYFLQLGWHLVKERTPWLYQIIRFKR